MTNALCFDHQIVFQPISLPVPLFIAGRYSMRGSANLAYTGGYVTRKDSFYSKETGFFFRVTTDGSGNINLEEINSKLSYSTKNLCFTRFNA